MAFTSTTIPAGHQRPGLWAADWLKTQLLANGWILEETLYSVPAANPDIVGTATGGTSGTLIDTSQNWDTNALIGAMALFLDGANAGILKTITANTATQITFSTSGMQTVTAGTNYVIYSPFVEVLKSPAASNGIGSDFYVSMYPLNSTVYFSIFEVWDEVTKMRRKFAASGFSYDVDPTDFSVLSEGSSPFTTSAVNTFSWLPTESSPLVLTCDASHFVVAHTNGVAQGLGNVLYAGVFDSFLPSSLDPMPICIGGFKESSSYDTYTLTCTRDIGATGKNAANFRFYSGQTSEVFYYAWPNRGTGGADPFRVGSTANNTVNKYALLPARYSSSTSYRGLLKSVVVNKQGTVTGDTLAVTMPDGSVKNFVLVSTPGGGSNQNAAQVYVPNESLT